MSWFYKHKFITRALSVLCLCAVMLCAVPDGFISPVASSALPLGTVVLPVIGEVSVGAIYAIGALLVSAGILSSTQVGDYETVSSAVSSFLSWVQSNYGSLTWDASNFTRFTSFLSSVVAAYAADYADELLFSSVDMTTEDFDLYREAVKGYSNTSSDGSIVTGLFSDSSFYPSDFLVYLGSNPIIFPTVDIVDYFPSLTNLSLWDGKSVTFSYFITPQFGINVRVSFSSSSSGTNARWLYYVTIFNGSLSYPINYSGSYTSFPFSSLPSSYPLDISFIASGNSSYPFSFSSNLYIFSGQSSSTSKSLSFSLFSSSDSLSRGSSWFNWNVGNSSWLSSSSGVFFSPISIGYSPTSAIDEGAELQIPISFDSDPDTNIGAVLGGTLVIDDYGATIREGTEDIDVPVNPDVPISWPSDLTGELDFPADTDGEVLNPDDSLAFKIPIIGWLVDLLSDLWDLIKSGFNKFGAWLKAIFDSIAGILDSLRGLPERFRQWFDDILDWLERIFDAIIGFVFDLGSILLEFLAFLSGYTIFQGLLSKYLPQPVYLVLWAFWVAALAMGLFRMVVNR